MAKVSKKKTTKKTPKKKRVGRKTSTNILGNHYLKSQPFPDDLDKFDWSQVQEFQKVISNSRLLWDLERIIETIEGKNYVLNKWEKQAFEKAVELYNIKYNNELTKAME